jgi:signal transduction histidine kinase
VNIFYSFQAERILTNEKFQVKLEELVEPLKEKCYKAFVENDLTSLKAIAREFSKIAEREDVLKIRLLDAENEVLLEEKKSEETEKVRKHPLRVKNEFIGTGFQNYGRVEIEFYDQDYPRRVSLRNRRLGSILLISLGTSLLFLFFGRQFIIEPMGKLVEAATQFGRGNLTPRLNIRSLGEIELLASTFEQMARKIQKLVEYERMVIWMRISRHIAHDLKSPLTPMQLDAESLRDELAKLIRKRKFPDEDLNKFFGELSEYFSNQLGYIERLRTEVDKFRKMGAKPVLESVKFDSFIKDFFKRKREEIPRSIRLDLRRVDPDLPQVFIDKDQMESVFSNLVDNAVTAMKGKGNLKISTELDKEEELLLLKFQDTGPGIPPEKLKRLFQPGGNPEKEEGWGLGLYLVKNMIEEHGGEIRVEAALGKGSTFTLVLPFFKIPKIHDREKERLNKLLEEIE